MIKMKKNSLKATLLVTLLSFAISSFGQELSKEQLIRETNELFTSCKKWDYEGIVIDNSGSLKYHICLTPECNPYVSWDFFIKNIKSIELGRLDEYTVINFTCAEKDCIVPTGYQKGGRYDLKNDLQFIIKDEKKGKQLVADLNKLKAIDWTK
jgi:hypothetical protein